MDGNFNIVTDTTNYFVDTMLQLEAYSTDAYCNTYFGNQKVSTDIEVCGSERILVADPNPAFEFTSTWMVDPNYQLTNLTSVFSLDKVTRCTIYKYELWDDDDEAVATSRKGSTIWSTFILIDQVTGVVTVNHNNKPSNANYNSTYEI